MFENQLRAGKPGNLNELKLYWRKMKKEELPFHSEKKRLIYITF